ncbi:MAG: hypothetical protein KBD01_07365 [Acidobacteria bacterium]|nr:hypothetical protein [Acidobacteriota bacterium]
MHTRKRLLVLAAALLAMTGPAAAALFESPSPELMYVGSAAELEPGVTILRDAAAFEAATKGLDPPFGGQVPDFEKLTVLRVVGRPKQNACRETVLKEVSTRFRSATIVLEERRGDDGCRCAEVVSPSSVWLVSVGRSVRRADLDVRETVTPCTPETTARPAGPPPPELILESSWDEREGSRVVTSADDYAKIMQRLGAGDRGADVDFAQSHVVVITTRPRENACRRTRLIDARTAAPDLVEFDVEEVYPAQGQMCAQMYSAPKAFVYRVPASVTHVKVSTREVR